MRMVEHYTIPIGVSDGHQSQGDRNDDVDSPSFSTPTPNVRGPFGFPDLCVFPLIFAPCFHPSHPSTDFNVALGFSFICFDAVLSLTLGLGVGTSLVVSAVRCVLQLSVMSLVRPKSSLYLPVP